MVGRKHYESRPAQRNSSRFSRVIVTFLIADVALFSYILSGYLFAARIVIPDQRITAPSRSYDQNAKPSPLVVWRAAPQQARAAIPVMDASSVANAAQTTGEDAEIRRVSEPAQRGVTLQGWHASATTGASGSGYESQKSDGTT